MIFGYPAFVGIVNLLGFAFCPGWMLDVPECSAAACACCRLKASVDIPDWKSTCRGYYSIE